MISQKEALTLLIDLPYEFAHLVGFEKLTELHNSWIRNMLFGEGDCTLQAHRGSYKTTCVSIALAESVILFPDLRTVFLRKTDADVKEVIRQVTRILESPYSKALVYAIYKRNLDFIIANSSEIRTNLTTDTKGTSQILGIGISGSLTGKHFDLIVTDDIVNVRDRVSRTERDHTKLAYQELQNVKNRGGRIINTGTPWHKDDCFTLMPEPKKYDCYSSGLMDEKQIDELRLRMTPSLFAANYELKHIASENIIFNDPKVGADIKKVINGLMHVDSAFYGEDYTAMSVMSYHDGKFYLYGKLWRKHVQDCYVEIKDIYDRLLCQRMLNETNADKGMVAKEIRNLGLRVQTYNESMNKHIKIVTYLKAIWADVVFVDGTDKEYIEQICDYNEDAEHDDAPDSAACLARVMYKRSKKKIYPSILGLYDLETM